MRRDLVATARRSRTRLDPGAPSTGTCGQRTGPLPAGQGFEIEQRLHAAASSSTRTRTSPVRSTDMRADLTPRRLVAAPTPPPIAQSAHEKDRQSASAPRTAGKLQVFSDRQPGSASAEQFRLKTARSLATPGTRLESQRRFPAVLSERARGCSPSTCLDPERNRSCACGDVRSVFRQEQKCFIEEKTIDPVYDPRAHSTDRVPSSLPGLRT